MNSSYSPIHSYKLYIQIDDDELRSKYKDQISDRIISNCRDSGFDLYLPNTQEYTPGKYHIFNHKIKCKMVRINGNNEYPSGYLLHPRSSTAIKYNLVLANGTGIIDLEYRGEIKASMFSNWTSNFINTLIQINTLSTLENVDLEIQNARNSLTQKIDKHTRIVQICAPDYMPFKVEIVDNLDQTRRGSGGFGSTGN